MEKRRLGNSDLDLTVVGFGAWAIGGPWSHGWGETDDSESIRAIQRAIDLGVNWIDTAHVYGIGHSERVVAQAVKGRRDKVLIATKCGLVDDGKGGIMPCLKRDSVRRELEGSLRRLEVDVIDLYQVHWPKPEEDIEEAWEEITKAKEEGLIRWAGVSNFNVEQMERAGRIAPVTSLQPPYSMLRPAIEAEVLPYCQEKGIGVVSYSPMLSGILTGKMTREGTANLQEGDWRRNSPEWREPHLSINIEFVEETLRPIAEKHGVAPGQIAVAWVLKNPAITSAIVGARRAAQVEETVKAASVSLIDEDLAAIKTGVEKRARALEEAKK